MTVYVLMRENQNGHGYIDVTIGGVFREGQRAREQEQGEKARARREGLRVCGDEELDDDGDWDVSWKIEEWELT